MAEPVGFIAYAGYPTLDWLYSEVVASKSVTLSNKFEGEPNIARESRRVATELYSRELEFVCCSRVTCSEERWIVEGVRRQ